MDLLLKLFLTGIASIVFLLYICYFYDICESLSKKGRPWLTGLIVVLCLIVSMLSFVVIWTY